MTRKLRSLSMLAAIGSLMLGTSAAAFAKIRCEGSSQIIPGHGAMPTPYCEDNYLAQVAREYGARVPASEIRNNPNSKERLCRFVGDDIRVRSICSQYLDRGGSRH